MTRKEANLEIIKILTDVINQNPDWRFGQILYNLSVITRDPKTMVILDPFYQESTQTLNQMKMTSPPNFLTDPEIFDDNYVIEVNASQLELLNSMAWQITAEEPPTTYYSLDGVRFFKVKLKEEPSKDVNDMLNIP